MIKYFIEDKEGRWLSNPDNPGETWTRDPYKAWAFDKRELSENESIAEFVRQHEYRMWWNKAPISKQFTNGDKLHEWLQTERCWDGWQLTEQEFHELPGASGPGSSYHLSKTSTQQFYDELIFGESIVRVTPGQPIWLPPSSTNGSLGM